jgi:hypothetical protein
VSDLKTATSAQPGLQISATQLTTSDAVLYTCPAGVTFLGDVWLTNTSGTPTASISLVKSGGTASASNRVFSRAFTAGESVKLADVKLAPGDFISGIASAGTAVSVVVDGTAFSSATVGVATGIQDDAIGTCNRTAATGTVGSAVTVGTGSNRYLLGALMVTGTTSPPTYATYDTLTMSSTDGAMTRLASADVNFGGTLVGSVHLFGRANPTSSSTQTVTANVAESGKTFNLVAVSQSLSGVGSVTGAATTGPTSASTLSLAVTSAAGNRPVFVAAFLDPPENFDKRVRAFNGNPAVANSPHWMIFADALGAGTVTATVSNSQIHAAVGVNLVPA